MKALIRVPELYREPPKGQPPSPWIRLLLVLTCTGVSFAHGSNDGQKGMGLIMLILIGIIPGVYALNPRPVASASCFDLLGEPVGKQRSSIAWPKGANESAAKRK